MTSSDKLAKVWEEVLSHLKDDVSPSQFEGYLKQITPLKLETDRIHLAVSSSFIKDGVERILKKGISEQLEGILGRSIGVFIQVEPGLKVNPAPAPITPEKPAPSRSHLNPKYRMEYYVVGASNRFAHAAALSVTKTPGEIYNPLFLWGPVGVGKTHLMQAIGHRILDENPQAKVVYVTAEVFTSECIDSIREQTTKEFQRRYRTVDVLLIDDVQFFEQTQHIQEMFFHTFNELYQKRRQIVLSSDRPPKALDRMQERLVNRFESGLTADIKPPDLETRQAILRELADRHGVRVEGAVLTHLADRSASNVRELEGNFNRVAAFSSLHATPISIELIDSVLEDLKRKEKRREVTPASIMQTVAEHYTLKVDDLTSRRQNRAVVVPRQVAMYLIYELVGSTLKQIAQQFGKKDHSTVIHACDRIRKELEESSPIGEAVQVLRLKLKEPGS